MAVRKGDEINKAVMSGGPSPLLSRPALKPASIPFVAKVAQQGAQGLYDKVQKLEAERANGRVVLALDPKRIRFSSLADRDERSLSVEDPDFAALVNDLRLHDQEVPIKVKPVRGDPDHDYEIVSGHRRHRACMLLDAESSTGRSVLALVDASASDLKVHAFKGFKDNKLRTNLSAWELGNLFLNWIDQGICKNQEEVAQGADLDKATVSQYIAVASLPEIVINAFGDKRVISLRWIPDLNRACKENLDGVQRVAKRLIDLPIRPSPAEILKELTKSKRPNSAEKGKSGGTKSESVKVGNKVMFTLSAKEGRYAIKLGKQVNSDLRRALQSDLKEFVQTWLHGRMGD